MNPSAERAAGGARSGFRHLGDRLVHHGAIWNLVEASFEAPDGTPFRRDVVRSPGAVGVIPIVEAPDGTPGTVLVRQYRGPFDAELLEIPAGMRDVDGEEPVETARRELIEEVGLRAAQIDVLTSFRPSAGMTDSVTIVCVARGCEPAERNGHGPEEEHMAVVPVALADALAMVLAGEITDAKTVIALLTLDATVGIRR